MFLSWIKYLIRNVLAKEKTQVFCYKKPIMRDKRLNKGVKSLTQTQIFASLYLCNLMV